MRNGILESATHDVMTAERGEKARSQIIEDFSNFSCEKCGGDQLVVHHTYKSITTYDRFIRCQCGAARDGQAATQSSQVPYSISADGYPDEEGKVDLDKPQYTRDDDVEGEIKIYCEDCYYKAIQDQQEWEDGDERDQKVEDSDASTFRCGACRIEIEIAETK